MTLYQKLNLMIGTESGKDVSVIFAEPSFKVPRCLSSILHTPHTFICILSTLDEYCFYNSNHYY